MLDTSQTSKQQHDSFRGMLSVVIPAYNEQNRLPKTLEATVQCLKAQTYSWEIIVVDDGSRDATGQRVNALREVEPRLCLISYRQNRGKGYAVRTGMLAARGDVVMFMDADGSTPLYEIANLLPLVINGADVVIGSRAAAASGKQLAARWYRKLLGRAFNAVINILVVPKVKDTQCGFKFFSRAAATTLFSRQKFDGFSFDFEILYLARKANFNLREVRVDWQHVSGSKVNLLVDSTKMLFDALRLPLVHSKTVF